MVPYGDQKITRIDAIKNNTDLTLTLSGQVLTITSTKDYKYFIFKTPF